MQKPNLLNYWALPSREQQSLINEALPPEEKACECADLTPVRPGDKYVYCVECHAMYEIITPYVVKRINTVE